ncbi:PAS domain-containing protein [Haloterrigena salina]|nr:PAS domain-containing protein [Haloterrigena salina]
MTPATVAPALDGPSPIAGELTALAVGDRRHTERVEAAVDDDDRIAVRTAPSVADAFPELDDVDCFVGSYPPENGTGLIERVTEGAIDLPVVLLVDEGATIGDEVRAHGWLDWVDRAAAIEDGERLRRRIRSLVERRRLAGLTRRSLAGIELAGDAIAIVAPDGTVQFANRGFAMQFGYSRDDLAGRSWRTLFTDDSVDRLETAAVPTVADGWRWTGSCTGRRNSGVTFPVRVRLGGPEDGGLVFVVEPVETDAEREGGAGDSS